MKKKRRGRRAFAGILAIISAFMLSGGGAAYAGSFIATPREGGTITASGQEDVSDTYESGRPCSVTVDYRDTDGESGVEGAEFTFYRIASLGTDGQNADDGKDAVIGFTPHSIIEGLAIDSDTKAPDIEDAVIKAYSSTRRAAADTAGSSAGRDDAGSGGTDSSSTSGNSGGAIKRTDNFYPESGAESSAADIPAYPEGGKVYTLVTGPDGKGTAAGMEEGYYLGMETKPAENYAASIPFIITLPEQVYGKSAVTADAWNYHVTVYPKVLPLGSLKITKTLKGDNVEKDREWHFTVTFETASADSDPEGTGRKNNTSLPGGSEYETNSAGTGGDDAYGTDYGRASETYTYKKSDGSTGEINSGGTVTLKGGENVVISGIPIGSVYDVSEAEENKSGYSTTAAASRGNITQGEPAAASFTNTRNRAKASKKTDGVQTSDSPVDRAYLIGAALCVLVLALAFVTRRKKKEQE